MNILVAEKNKNASWSKGRTHHLDELTQGRILVNFMHQRANPHTNRFYQNVMQRRQQQRREE
jgi:hypothetical protein